MKGIGPLGRELCKIFQGQVHRKIIKTIMETSTWTRHASVQQHQFCPSVADSWCGWQPVQAGSDEDYVHHNIMPCVGQRQFLKWSSWPTSAWRIKLCSSHAWEWRRKARMRLLMQPWSGICGPNRDLLVLKWWSYQHIWLQPALIMELSPSWLFNAKSGCTTGSFTDPVCNYAKMPKESGRLKSRLVRSRSTGEKLWESLSKRRKHFEEKAMEAEGQTYEPGAFWPWFLWVTCVFWSSNFVLFGGMRLTPCTMTF